MYHDLCSIQKSCISHHFCDIYRASRHWLSLTFVVDCMFKEKQEKYEICCEELTSPSLLTIGIVKRLINFRFLFQFLNHQFIVFNYINCALLFHTSIALWNGTLINIICSNVYKTFMDSWTKTCALIVL